MGSAESAAVVDFRILGSLDVACDGRPIPVKPAKARALLALLLIEPGRVIATDRLIDELWGDEPPASAAVSLRVLVSRLRDALSGAGLPDAVATRSPGYVLDVDHGQVDALRFDTLVARGHDELAAGDALLAAGTLRDALALWRGPALADVTDSPAATAEAARLDESRMQALEERIDADLACGRHATVIAELESLVRAHPLRERLWASRMLALYRSGRQADALAVDEFSAIADGERMARLVEVVRSWGAAVVLAPQCIDGMGGPEATARILNSAHTIILHQVPEPEQIVKAAGTKMATEWSLQHERGLSTDVGSTRTQHQLRVDPNDVRRLSPGMCFVIGDCKGQQIQIVAPPRVDTPPPRGPLAAPEAAPEDPEPEGPVRL